MGLGGNPYGPAGTGKTESVKALGGLFGRQVLVFNCDEVTILLYCLFRCPLIDIIGKFICSVLKRKFHDIRVTFSFLPVLFLVW